MKSDFIEVTIARSGKKKLVNKTQIATVDPLEDGSCRINLKLPEGNGYQNFAVKESYANVAGSLDSFTVE
jgi:hypothetical protein